MAPRSQGRYCFYSEITPKLEDIPTPIPTKVDLSCQTPNLPNLLLTLNRQTRSSRRQAHLLSPYLPCSHNRLKSKCTASLPSRHIRIRRITRPCLLASRPMHIPRTRHLRTAFPQTLFRNPVTRIPFLQPAILKAPVTAGPHFQILLFQSLRLCRRTPTFRVTKTR